MLADLSSQEILIHYGIIPPMTPAFIATPTNQHIVYRSNKHSLSSLNRVGVALIVMSLGAFVGAFLPFINLEAHYEMTQFFSQFSKLPAPAKSAITAPEFNPLVTPDGKSITPIDSYFSLIIPKIGVNAPVIPGVNPLNTSGYTEALKKGVAHSSTSFYPDENGTVYLFSHSTNYEWFVKDLNAVFYLLKNVEPGDTVVVMYLGNRYTYKVREKQIVPGSAISYLVPQTGKRNLILETCWPPGTIAERLLIFADLIEEKIYGKFKDVRI